MVHGDGRIWRSFSFTKAILTGEPIKIFNHGRMKRDFTYIDDIVEGIVRLLEKKAEANPQWNSDQPDPATSFAPYRVYNIGNRSPVELLHFIEVLEDRLGRKAKKQFLPMQAGDVVETFADVQDFMQDVGFKPSTTIEEGMGRFVDWYKTYYRVGVIK
jgi:UDP-glucuronate 4-epimerase